MEIIQRCVSKTQKVVLYGYFKYDLCEMRYLKTS